MKGPDGVNSLIGRLMMLICVLVPLMLLAGGTVHATVDDPYLDFPDHELEHDPSLLDDRYKLQNITIFGVGLQGFDKNKLDYTYTMSGSEQAAITKDYLAAVAGIPFDSEASVVESVNGNKVSLYVFHLFDAQDLTYTVTFVTGGGGGGSGSGSGLIVRENGNLNTYLSTASTTAELVQKTRNSLRLILAEILRISDPVEAEKAYRELQNTLRILASILERAGGDQSLVGDISDITNASRHLVLLVRENGTLTELTAGYFNAMGGVFSKTDMTSANGNKLKNNIRLLGNETVHQTGTLNAAPERVTQQGDRAVASFTTQEITAHMGISKQHYTRTNSAMNALLGIGSPRQLEYQIALKAPRDASVNEMNTALEKGILDAIYGGGAVKLELQLGEAALMVTSRILNSSERELRYSAVFSQGPSSGLPAGAVPVADVMAADIELTSDLGDKSAFSEPALLTLDMKAARLTGYTPEMLKRLGLYRWNGETLRWDAVGGNYDPIARRIAVYRQHLSKYAVLKTEKTFSDVSNSWAKNDINELLGKGVLVESAAFDPKGELTREDFARWLSRAYGLDGGDQALPFKDIAQTHPYYSELAGAYSQGLIKGKSADAFDPKGKITRQEMATLISNALVKYQKAKMDSMLVSRLDKYPDRGKIAGWAENTVALVNELGVMQGDSRGFRPTDTITREEAASLLKRIYN